MGMAIFVERLIDIAWSASGTTRNQKRPKWSLLCGARLIENVPENIQRIMTASEQNLKQFTIEKGAMLIQITFDRKLRSGPKTTQQPSENAMRDVEQSKGLHVLYG